MFYFTKMQALGNDFMVIDAVTQKLNISARLVKKLGDRNLGVGFDQLLIVEPPINPEYDFHYRIFNNDGSEVSQCGNGARCFAAFVHQKKLSNKAKLKVSTMGGVIELELKEAESVKVDMGAPIWQPAKIPFQAQQQSKTYLLTVAQQTLMAGVVSMGNPHCVIQVEDLEKYPVQEIGSQLEVHPRFPKKTNVPFYQVITPEHIKLRVFERAAGETQSCGSGACAAVAVGIHNNILSKGKAVLVETRGGNLSISWSGNLEDSLYMTGPVKFVFEGMINLYNI